jgi:H+/Cl- antiporter ClcA
MDFRQKIIVEGIAVGFFAGVMAILYRYLLSEAESLRREIYSVLKMGGFYATLLWFVFLFALAYVLGLIVKKEPMVSGSGIPQVKGVLSGQLKMNWIKVIIFKFLGGVLALGVGLSLGREGPSVQLGAAAGQGFSRAMGRLRVEEKYLITCGASAGLSAAFNAPLAGTIFALEELHKNFSPMVMVPAMVASLTAGFVSQQFFGQMPVFNFGRIKPLPLNHYFYVLLLGIVTGLFGIVFNTALIKTQDFFKNIKILRPELKPAIPFVIAGVLGFVMPEVLGGGGEMIDSLNKISFTLYYVVILLVVKFFFTMTSYGSGVPGGIFLPLLVIGALTGDVYGTVVVKLMDLNPEYIKNFLILAMAGYFSAIVKAPITGSILITEMTGSFSHLLALSIVSVTSYLVTDLFKSKPIYDTLLERLTARRGSKYRGPEVESQKILMEVPVCLGSAFDGRKVKDVRWPENCLLVGINRGDLEIIPKGDTIMLPGDYLVVLTDETKAAEINKKLLKLGVEPEEHSAVSLNETLS